MSVSAVPEGYHTVTPYLIVSDVAKLIEFLKEAFGAETTCCHTDPDGRVVHAEARIGDSPVMMGGACPEWSPMPATLHLYVPDVDALYARSLAAGAESIREPRDEFYGDRSAGVRDSNGNCWWFATHQEDVSPEEIARRHAAATASAAG